MTWNSSKLKEKHHVVLYVLYACHIGIYRQYQVCDIANICYTILTNSFSHAIK